MNSLLSRLDSATRLMRSGDLRAATNAIQDALKAPPATSSGDAQPSHASAVVLDPGATFGNSKQRQPLIIEHAPVVRPSEPCGDGQPAQCLAGTFLRGQYSDVSGARDYRLFVPPRHVRLALPMIVMLHGCTQDPESFALGTGMNDAALDAGFFVLYPAQPQTANANRCWNWFEPAHQQRGKGEPALIAGMTRKVIAEYGIDPHRIYIAGLSAGGAMAMVLAETYPDVFAAVGVHSGIPTGVALDVGSAFVAMKGPAARAHLHRGKSAERTVGPDRNAGKRFVPTIVFHGDRDATVHASNGGQISERVMAKRQDSCTATQECSRSPNGREFTRKVHRDATGHVVSEYWTVHGGSHAWSGGRLEGSYTDPKGPDATQAMVRFFLSQAKN